MLEDFMNNNGACLYLRHCGHKLYYVEVWKIRLKPISKTGGAVYPADTIYVLMDNIKDFIKFLKEYTFCGSYGYLDTDKDIIDFIKEDAYPIITYQEWEQIENKEYYLD